MMVAWRPIVGAAMAEGMCELSPEAQRLVMMSIMLGHPAYGVLSGWAVQDLSRFPALG